MSLAWLWRGDRRGKILKKLVRSHSGLVQHGANVPTLKGVRGFKSHPHRLWIFWAKTAKSLGIPMEELVK